MIGRIFRLAGATFFLTGFYLHSLLGELFIRDPVARRQFFTRNTGRYSGRILSALGCTIERKISRPDLFARDYFVVCNHVSYLDILVMSCSMPAVFVTSTEVEDMLLLGRICEFGGSLFVDRQNRKRITEDSQMLQRVLREGFKVVVYPEGTTSDGASVSSFKSSFFAVPVASGTPILPVCIKYKTIGGQPFSKKNSDLVCWYGDMEFGPHYLQLGSIGPSEIELVFLEPIEVTPGSNRRDLARRIEEMIRAEYHRGRDDSSALA